MVPGPRLFSTPTNLMKTIFDLSSRDHLRPMTELESKAVLLVTMNPDHGVPPEMEEMPRYTIMVYRIQWAGYRLEDVAEENLYFLAAVLVDRPATAVQWAHALVRLHQKLGRPGRIGTS